LRTPPATGCESATVAWKQGEGASVAAAALGDAASLLQLCTAGSGARAIRRGGYHAKERRSPKKADAGEQC